MGNGKRNLETGENKKEVKFRIALFFITFR